jgi:tol-pal system protein YbgF
VVLTNSFQGLWRKGNRPGSIFVVSRLGRNFSVFGGHSYIQDDSSGIFIMFKSSVFAALLLSFVSMPVAAQDIATRILNMENRLRDLTGQMEELNFSMQQLQKQLANGQQQGAAEPSVPKLKKLATTETEQGVETIEDAPVVVAQPNKRAIILGAEPIETQELAPGPTNLASGQDNSAGGTGQIVEPESAQDVAVATAPNSVVVDADNNGIENVSLTPSADTPEALYEKHYETLLRRQFGEAEAGFRQFLEKYPDHSLAGSAQYQLGETFYAQANYQEAARNFLQGYKNYPKSRRAPDSLLKLGLSLRKLDQRDQACAALASVSTEFPRAVEAKKRAQAELKRAGC